MSCNLVAFGFSVQMFLLILNEDHRREKILFLCEVNLYNLQLANLLCLLCLAICIIENTAINDYPEIIKSH